MTQSWNNARFKKSCLAGVIAVLLSPSVYALESLSDNNLSETTGEGIALLPENFKMVFQGPNDISTASSYNNATISAADKPKHDTGFIRIIPTGENYELLYQRAYDKIYKQNYNSNYAYAKANLYQGSYNSTYDTVYNGIYQNGSTTTTTYTTTYSQVKTKNETTYRNQEISPYLKQKTYTDYYNKRYDQYYWNAPALVPDDGTTKYGGAWLNEEKAAENARLNTIEKIEAAYGSTITTAVNNHLKETTLAQIRASANSTAAQQATSAANTTVDNYAKTNAANVANTTATGAITNARTKADVFIYGLALSKSNGNLNERYSNVGLNWGSAANPWLFRAGTAKDIQQFSGANKSDISYLALEAPLAKDGIDATSDRIKLGFWTDIFSRSLDSIRTINAVTGAPESGLDKDYRLRSQFVANGLSINGSQIRLFQTQNDDVNKLYDETLGIAALLRINTNDDPSALKFTDTNLNEKGIRISTAAKTDADDGTAVTPAMDGSLAPLFNDKEGLYLYSANINLVLGNMYQPFILASEGNNIILEVTRIPKIPTIYSQIYTLYADTDPNPQFQAGTGLTKASFKGSTCNVSYCGSNFSDITTGTNTVRYQGTNATHSSIAIGSVTRDVSTNLLKANRGADATGIVFKSPSGSAVNLGSAVIDGVLIQHLKFKTTGL